MKSFLVGLLIGFVSMFGGAQIVACASSSVPSVGYSPPPDAAAADGGDDGGDPSADDDPSANADASPFSPYLRGALAVQARGCPACHQSADASAGVLSGQTTPIPGTGIYGKNLTPDPETGIGGLTDSQILGMLRQGKDESGGQLCTIMPRFTDMNADEESSILVYLRALAPVHREIPDGLCAWENDAGDAGEGEGGTCDNLVQPDDPAPCHACMHPPCQANGCFNGFVCDLTTKTCRPPVTGCE